MSHTFAWMNKVTLDLHASTRANLIYITEYIRRKYPSTLIAFYSDHGANQEIWDNEWVDHGHREGTNNGFMIAISDKFASKKKRTTFELKDTTNIWAGVSMSLQNVNLPRYHQHIPEPRFQDDAEELLQIYRTRELQLSSVLGELEGDNPLIGKIDLSKSVKENIEKLGKKNTDELLSRYKAWLIDQEPAFGKKVKLIQNRDVRGFTPFLPWMIFLSAIALVILGNFIPNIKARLFPLVSTSGAMILGWFLLLCIEGVHTNFGYYSMSCHFLFAMAIILHIVHLRRQIGEETEGQINDFQFYSRVAFLLASAIAIIKVAFVISQQMEWNIYLVYFLNKPTTYFGWIALVVCGSLLLREAWQHIFLLANGSWGNYGKFKLSIHVANTAAIVVSIWGTIAYEMEVLKKKNLTNDEYQSSIVGSIDLSFLFVIITSNLFFSSVAEKSMLAIVGLIFMSFWACNLSRILLFTVLGPLLILFIRKAPSDKRFESPIFVVQMIVFLVGFFNSTGEEYHFDVSQRAIQRYPHQSPGDNIVKTTVHIFFIKFCSSLLVSGFLAICKVNWSLLEEYTFTVCYAVLFFPFAYAMTTTDRLKHNYLSFLVSNIVVVIAYGLATKGARLAVSSTLGSVLDSEKDVKPISNFLEVEFTKSTEIGKNNAQDQ